LETLKSNLLEKNLKRLIEPYSRVEIAQISKLIELPEPEIEVKNFSGPQNFDKTKQIKF